MINYQNTFLLPFSLCAIAIFILYSYPRPTANRSLSILPHQSYYRLNKNRDSRYIEAVKRKVNKNLDLAPDWVREYAEWHADQRKHHMADPSTKFLIMACHRNGFCGGVGDRLKSISFYLLLAHKMHRVLLIKWEKGNIEDYLVPPVGGIDWTCPDDIDIGTKPDTSSASDMYLMILNPLNNQWAPKTKLIIRSPGKDFYGQFKRRFFTTEKRPYGAFTEIWDVLFEPTPPVKKAIAATMHEFGLIPKKYAVAQYRAPDRYHEIDGTFHLHDDHSYTPGQTRKREIHNAINCAFQLSVNYTDISKVYFTSSDINDVKYVVNESPYKNKVIGKDDVIHFHSEKVTRGGWKDTDPALLYPVYVDLYLMRYSRCVSFGILGFGHFGARLSGDECVLRSASNVCPTL